MTHPRSARALPLEGAHPAAWQSQFRGCRLVRHYDVQSKFLET